MKHEHVLLIVSKSPKGFPWSIDKDMANDIINTYNIKLECRNGDMSGEESGLFCYENETIRIKRTWKNTWELYHGDWEPDPHWTGD